jgi:hypothetical protein
MSFLASVHSSFTAEQRASARPLSRAHANAHTRSLCATPRRQALRANSGCPRKRVCAAHESHSPGNPSSNLASLGRDLRSLGVAPDLRAYILRRLESSEKERLEERARAERERERAEQERARAEQERAARIAAEQRWCTVA